MNVITKNEIGNKIFDKYALGISQEEIDKLIHGETISGLFLVDDEWLDIKIFMTDAYAVHNHYLSVQIKNAERTEIGVGKSKKLEWRKGESNMDRIVHKSKLELVK